MAKKKDSGLVFYHGNELKVSETPNKLINENVIRILMTNRGERVNNLNFGSNLRSYLFIPEMLMSDIVREITTSIQRFEPRAEVISISIAKTDEDVVTISLSIRNVTNGEINPVEINI